MSTSNSGSSSTAAPAPGIHSLSTLLRSLRTTLHPSTFVWVTLPPNQSLSPLVPTQLVFREAEGTTIVTTREAAEENNLSYVFPSRMITLDVHSSLEAVGFMAVVSRKLADLGVGSNPVSGFFHDHVFVPEGAEANALTALEEIRKGATKESDT